MPVLRLVNDPDPRKVLSWLMEQEHAVADQVEDACVKLAQFPHRRMPRLSRRARYFLAERLRLADVFLEAISTTCDQAVKPVFLFALPRCEDLLEQQVLWALVAYWKEHGRNRWFLRRMSQLHFEAKGEPRK